MTSSRCTVRSFSLLIVVAIALTAPGCGLTLDYTLPDDASADAASEASVGDAGPHDAAMVDAARIDADVDAALDDAGAIDASFDAPDSADIGPVECVSPADCDALGTAPCGAWECNANTCEVHCAGCTTDLDLDGYGVGMGCAGGDCDDADDTVGASASTLCYGGTPGSEGVGACHAGTSECTDGVWGACLGSIVPSAESCNGIDDDCNGRADDSLGSISCGLGLCSTSVSLCGGGGALAVCVPIAARTTIDSCAGGDEDCDGRVDEDCTDCFWVGATGSDVSVTPRTPLTPFRSVQHAIDTAAGDPTGPQRVCLLAASCTATTVFSGAVNMAQGVEVMGNYGPTGMTRCGTTIRTEIQTGDATGVRFGDGILSGTTVLADVAITPSGTPTSAGVTVEGAIGAVIRGVMINPGPSVTNGYGIDIHGGGDAIVTRSAVFGGRGSSESIGVRVDGGHVQILDNCPVALDAAGRCPSGCPNATVPGIRGRQDSTPSRSSTSYAIMLRDAQGSLVATTATCGQISGHAAGIRIEGEAVGVVVRGSFVPGWGGNIDSYGIDLADCGDASPWIVDNAEINAEGPPVAPTAAIRSLGACHPVIERNLRVVSGLEGGGMTTGILCGALSGRSSRCVIEQNPDIRGAIAGNPVAATGVSCEADGCARIVGNTMAGFQGQTLVGLRLGTTDALVDRNRISGGCATSSAVAVLATDSRARLENNLLFGGSACVGGTTASASRFIAMMATGTDATHVLDVHGNDLDPSSARSSTCASRGLELDGGPGAPIGVFRGNIVLAGTCPSAYSVYELDASSDPIAFESNDVPASSTTVVYRDEGTTDVATAALVDAMTDAIFSSNLDAAPGFTSYPGVLDLAAGSMCIDRDLSAGASSHDFDGHARTGTPDIGAYEH